jgi:hypothetical protein
VQPTNACDTGTLDCSGGTPVCKDSGTPVSNGTSCGVNQQCTNGACCGLFEICNNGIDDNCNGLVDCADPQCTVDGGTNGQGQWACQPLPSGGGWSIVAYDPTTHAACPASFATTATDVLSNIAFTNDTCGCNCTNTKAAHCQGTWGWTENATSSCGNKPSGGLTLSQGGCLDNSGDNLDQASYWIGAASNVVTVAGTCTGAGKVTTAPAVTDDQGETCALPQAGGGCPALSACVPVAPAPFQLCSVESGTATCPTGLVASSVYTGFDDTRSCGACACATGNLACTMTGANFYEASGCTGASCEIGTSCAKCTLMASGNTNSMAGVFTSNNTETVCGVTTPSAPTGTVTKTGPLTVCCVP